MLKVKYLTLFKQKIEKRQEFWPRLQEKSSSAFQPKFSSLSNASDFRAITLILSELWPFSPHNLSKNDFFFKFSSKWPPQEESKCKNAQFLQWILKGDVVYFKKITAS